MSAAIHGRGVPAPFDEVLSASTLDAEPASVCVVDNDGVIVFVNREWDRFAGDNGGEQARGSGVVGKRWLDAISGEMARRFFGEAMDRAGGSRWNEPRTVFLHGECHSPTEARDMATQLAPIFSPERDRRLGVLVSCQIVATEPIGRRYPVRAPNERRYRDEAGLMMQCFGCRRVQVPHTLQWDFVPDYMARPQPETSHGICATCLELFYGRELAERVRRRVTDGEAG